jgi:PDZ domain-containing secreted protein
MNILIGIPLVFLAILVIILLVVLQFVIRIWLKIRKHMRGDFTDEEVERLSRKYHKEADAYSFGRDYFKRSENTASNDSYQSQQPRTSQTAAGVTIIDDRDPGIAKRKIFTEDEGEYVEYEEE